jgi:hypothetical protein
VFSGAAVTVHGLKWLISFRIYGIVPVGTFPAMAWTASIQNREVAMNTPSVLLLLSIAAVVPLVFLMLLQNIGRHPAGRRSRP